MFHDQRVCQLKTSKTSALLEGIEDDAPPVLEQQGLVGMGSSKGKILGKKSMVFPQEKNHKSRKLHCKSTSNPRSMLRVSLTHMLLIGGFQIWTQKVKESIYK